MKILNLYSCKNRSILNRFVNVILTGICNSDLNMSDALKVTRNVQELEFSEHHSFQIRFRYAVTPVYM